MKTLRPLLKILIIIMCVVTLANLINESNSSPIPRKAVVIVYIDERIDEGTVLLIKRGVSTCIEQGATHLILAFNTYGGYLYSMDKIIESLVRCPCKRVAWIPPSSKAVSAGALIALACDEMYVGKDSVFGVCQPRPYDEKIVNYVKTRIRALLAKANVTDETNVELLEEMVTKNRGFTGSELVKLGLAKDFANNLHELLEKLNLKLEETVIVELRRDLLCEVIGLMLDPGVAVIMLILGILLIILEVKVTGFQGWGIVGGMFVALGLYSFGMIGVNVLALTFIILGITAIIIELKKPGLQVFGVGGIMLLILAVIISYMQQPFIETWRYILPSGIFIGVVSGFLLFIIVKASQAIRLKRLTLREKLTGKIGMAKTTLSRERPGVVFVEGEDWTAFSLEGEIKPGRRVKVVEYKDGILFVKEVQ